MDIQFDAGCHWELRPDLPLLEEEPVWHDSDLNSFINELLCGTGETSTAESQAVSPALVQETAEGQPTGTDDPTFASLTDRASGDGGDWCNLAQDTGGGPGVICPYDRGEAAGITDCEPLQDTVHQTANSVPLGCPRQVVKTQEVAAASSALSDQSEASLRSAADPKEVVGNLKRSSSGQSLRPLTVKKPCRRADVAESVGGADRQTRRSIRNDAPAGVVASSQPLNMRVPESTATTPESVTDEAYRKRQLRLMRNRESASESRSRKKDYLKELESRCRYLEDHCTNLQQVVHHTAMENLALKNELARAKNYTGTVCGEAEPAALESDSLPSESLPRRIYPCLMANLLFFLTVGLCHGWWGTVFLEILLGAAAKGQRRGGERVSRVSTGGAIHVAGGRSSSLGRPQLLPGFGTRGHEGTWHEGCRTKLPRRPFKRRKKRLRNSTLWRSRVKSRRAKRVA